MNIQLWKVIAFALLQALFVHAQEDVVVSKNVLSEVAVDSAMRNGKSKKRPNFKPNKKPNFKPNKKPNFKPNKKPNFKPNKKPNFKPNKKPNFKPNKKPNFKPNKKPNFKPSKPNKKPNFKPNKKPNFKPNKRPRKERPSSSLSSQDEEGDVFEYSSAEGDETSMSSVASEDESSRDDVMTQE